MLNVKQRMRQWLSVGHSPNPKNELPLEDQIAGRLNHYLNKVIVFQIHNGFLVVEEGRETDGFSGHSQKADRKAFTYRATPHDVGEFLKARLTAHALHEQNGD